MEFTINNINTIKQELSTTKLISYKLSGSTYTHFCDCMLGVDIAFSKLGTSRSLAKKVLLNDNLLTIVYNDDSKCIYTLDITLGQSLKFIMLACNNEFYSMVKSMQIKLLQERLANDTRFIVTPIECNVLDECEDL